jgi:hypothetical protein
MLFGICVEHEGEVVTTIEQSAYELTPDTLALVLGQNRDRPDVGAERAVRNRPRVADEVLDIVREHVECRTSDHLSETLAVARTTLPSHAVEEPSKRFEALWRRGIAVFDHGFPVGEVAVLEATDRGAMGGVIFAATFPARRATMFR